MHASASVQNPILKVWNMNSHLIKSHRLLLQSVRVLDDIPIPPHKPVGDLLRSLSASQPNPASFTLSPSLGWLLPSISSNPRDQGNNLSHCSRSACSSIPPCLFIMLAFVCNSNCLGEATMKTRLLPAFTQVICIAWPGGRVRHRKWFMETAIALRTQWEKIMLQHTHKLSAVLKH